MSKRNNKLLLADILTAINKIQTYTQGLDYEAFMALMPLNVILKSLAKQQIN